MGIFVFLIIFFWVQVLENAGLFGDVLVSLGNGMEIRISLIVKVFFLVFNVIYFIVATKKIRIPKILIFSSLFLILSTLSVFFSDRIYFVRALSVSLHIQLMINISLFVYLYGNIHRIKKIYQSIRIFALINAVFVIVSYVFPNWLPIFETFDSGLGGRRAFGIMGDEVSLFLTFFFFDSLVFEKYKHSLIYMAAILANGSIGTSLIVFFLIGYYLKYVLRYDFSRFFIFILIVLIAIIPLSRVEYIQNFAVFRRIEQNFSSPEKESGKLRLVSITVAYEMIKQRPIFGYGYGSYGFHVKDKYNKIYTKFKGDSRLPSMVILTSAFNPYVQMVCESGFFGLTLYVLFLLNVAKIFKRNIKCENIFIRKMSIVAYGWFVVFCMTAISANWLLPASFILLLIVILIGLHLKLGAINDEI